MVNKNILLPKGCFIRPADLDDQSGLKQLLWEFTLSQGLRFHFQQFIYIPIIIVALLVSVGIAWFLNADMIIVTSLAGIILLTIIYILWWIFIKPGLNWEKYWVIECHFRLVACGTIEQYPTYAYLNYLYVQPEWGYDEELTTQRDYRKLNTKSDRAERSAGGNRTLTEYLVRYLSQEATPPIYLLSQPKMIEFYTNIGFVRPYWSELPPQVAKRYRSFRNSALGILIQYIGNQ